MIFVSQKFFHFLFILLLSLGCICTPVILMRYMSWRSIAGELWREDEEDVSVVLYHSAVWELFGFSVSIVDATKKVVDETASVSKQCRKLSNFVAIFSNFQTPLDKSSFLEFGDFDVKACFDAAMGPPLFKTLTGRQVLFTLGRQTVLFFYVSFFCLGITFQKKERDFKQKLDWFLFGHKQLMSIDVASAWEQTDFQLSWAFLRNGEQNVTIVFCLCLCCRLFMHRNLVCEMYLVMTSSHSCCAFVSCEVSWHLQQCWQQLQRKGFTKTQVRSHLLVFIS